MTRGEYTIYVEAVNTASSQESFVVSVRDNTVPVVSQNPDTRTITGCSTDDITGPVFSTTLTTSSYAVFSDGTNLGVASDNCTATGSLLVRYQDAATPGCPIVVVRTWYLQDASGNEVSVDQTININAPAVSINSPAPLTESDCQTQAAIDASFASWLSGFTASGGCDLSTTMTPVSPSAPGRCGGDITVFYEVSSRCTTTEIRSSTFTVTTDTAPSFVDHLGNSNYPADISISLSSNLVCSEQVSWPRIYVDDNCATYTLTRTIDPPVAFAITNEVINSFGQFTPGVYTITYDVVDICGLTDTHSFVVTVTDGIPPSMTNIQTNKTKVTDPDVCTSFATWSSPTVSDACGFTLETEVILSDGTVLFPFTPTEYNFPVGTNTVTFIATDNNLNETRASFTVVVTDNQPPTVDCPVFASSFSVDAGECFASLDFTSDIDIDDNCGIATIIYSIGGTPISFPYEFPVGTTTVDVFAEDINGLTNTCSFDVTVVDDEDPVVQVVASLTVELNSSGTISIAVGDIDDDSDDNCGIDTRVLSQEVFTCADLGPNTVTLTVTDVNGNSASASTVVTVIDIIDPVVECIGNVSENADTDECSWTYTGTNPTWGILSDDDNCTIITRTFVLSGATTGSGDDITGQAFNVGVTTVSWTVFDQSNNQESCSFTVTVTDTQAPVFTAFPTPDPEYFTDSGVCYASLDFSADIAAGDNCGIDDISYFVDGLPISFPYNFPVGSTTVTVVATDENSMTVTDNFTIVVSDNQDPIISCASLSTPAIERTADPGACNKEVVIELPIASDNCGIATYTMSADAIPAIDFTVYEDALDGFKLKASAVYPLGTTNVTLTVIDINGRTASCTFSVTIHFNALPVAAAQDITVELDGSGSVSITPEDIDNGSSITTCAFESWSVTPVTFGCNDVGDNTVTLTVTDKTGRVATTTAVVTVKDNEFPVLVTQNITVELDINGEATIVANDLIYSITDNCATLSPTIDIDEFDCNDVGNPVVVTVSVEDQNGNVTTETAVVTVIDVIPPTLVADDFTVQLDGDGLASIDPFDVFNALGSSDNCGIDTSTLSLSQSSFDCNYIGDVTVSLYGKDASGNPATVTFIVTVEDDIEPVLTCVGDQLEVGTNDGCTYLHSGTAWDPTVTDNCTIGSPTYTLSGATTGTGTSLDGVSFAQGVTTVLWSVTDAGGNTVTCSFDVEVVDDIDPVLACPADIVQTAPALDCDLSIFWARPVPTDNCGVETLTITSSAVTPILFQTSWNGSFFEDRGEFPVGITTVTYTAIDAAGNSSTCDFTVTLHYSELPVAAAQDITVELDGSGSVSITPEDIDNGSSITSCAFESWSVTPDTFDCDDVGDNTVTLTVVDKTGRIATATAIVTVEDNEFPVLVTQNITVELDINGVASIVADDLVSSITDNCATLSPTIDIDSFDCDDLGNPVVVTVSVEDQHGNVTTETAVVTVVDLIAPTLVADDITIQLDASGEASIDPADVFNALSSSDNCAILTSTLSLSRDSFNCSDIGNVTVTLYGEDASGNPATVTFILTVEDNIDPVLTCVGHQLEVGTNDGCEYLHSGTAWDPAVTDNCTIGSPTYTLSGVTSGTGTSLNGVAFAQGVTTVLWSVTDAGGNTVTCTFDVEVVDDVPPVFAGCPPDVTLPTTGCNVQFHQWVPPTVSDNCSGIVSVSVSTSNSGVVVNTTNPSFHATNFPVGVTTVYYVATDAAGNVETCSFNVTVDDGVNPVARAQDIEVQLDVAGQAIITPDMVDNGSTDNCGIDYMTVVPSEFDCSHVGTPQVVTLTVYDLTGRSATATAVVTVLDEVAPEVIVQNVTVVLDADGNGVVDINDIIVNATDACGIFTSTIDRAEFDCSDVGQVTVSVTVTDNNNNSTVRTATVTVEDNTAPDVVVQNTTVSLDANGEGSIEISDVVVSADDACGILSTTLSIDQFTCANLGPVTVTVTVTDVNLNTTVEYAVVNVIDEIAPTVACVTDTFRYTTPGLCGYLVIGAEFDPEADDNCEVAIITNTFNNLASLAGATFPVGDTDVTWYVSDSSGNVSECTITITVEDNEDPVFVVFPDDVNLPVTNIGVCNRLVGWDIPLVDDNCDIQSLTYTVATNNTTATPLVVVPDGPGRLRAEFPAGITTITYTVTDVNGNSATKSFTVTIRDLDNPVAIAQNIDVYLDDNGEAIITADMVDNGSFDACGDVILSVSPSTFDCNDLFTPVLVTLTVTDLSGNSSTATAYVTVLDDIEPEIECIADIAVENTAGECGYIVSGTEFDLVVAEDNCAIITQTYTLTGDTDSGGAVQALTLQGVEFAVGETTVVWTLIDASGNSSNCLFVVTVTDTEPPVIASVDDFDRNTDAGECDYTVVGSEFDPVSFSDNCGTVTITNDYNNASTLDGAVFPKGITEVTWTAIDGVSLTATTTFIVTVTDNEAPFIACVTDTFRYTTPSLTEGVVGLCGYEVIGAEFDPQTDDNCAVATITNTFNGLATLAGEVFDVGLTSVTWYVTDTSGNVSECTIVIEIEDNEPPIFVSFPVNQTLTTPSTQACEQEHVWNVPVADDNCGLDMSTFSRSWSSTNPSANIVFLDYATVPAQTSAQFPVGTTTITYSITDIHGNTHTQSFTVTVDDGQDPIVSAPVDRSILGCTTDDITGPVFATDLTLSSYAEFTGGENLGTASDNCGIAEIWYQDVIVNAACPIEVERTWYIIDFNNRSVSVTQTITVDETEAPVLAGTLPGGEVPNTCFTSIPAAPDVADIAALYTDNCTVTLTATLVSTEVVGDDCGWIVTYTFSVTDDCLNETIAEVVYFGRDSEAPQLADINNTCADFNQSGLNQCLATAEDFDATTLEAGIAALYTDNCGTVTATLVNTLVDGTDCEWTIVYTFEISDDCDNTLTCTVTYEGGDTEAPELAGTLPGEDVGNVCINNRPSAPDVADIAALYTDNCGTITATLVNTELVGNNCGWTVTYTYTVEDECGNFAPNAVVVYSGRDTEAPVVTNDPDFILAYDCRDIVPAPNETSLSWSDNCATSVNIVLIESVETQLGCENTYVLTRTWSVTDPCGNNTIFNQVITVEDNEAPTLVDADEDCDSLNQTDLDWCYSEILAFDATTLESSVASLYEDNCGTVSATLVDSAIAGDDCGWIAMFVFEIYDECLNTVTCTITYTGRDQTAPSLTDTPYAGLSDVDSCIDFALDAAPFDASLAIQGYTDNCNGTVTAVLSLTELSGDDCGWVITHTFTVVDECGNELTGQTYTNTGRDQTAPELTGIPYAGLSEVNACLAGAVDAAPFDAELAAEGYTDDCDGVVTAVLTDTEVVGTDCAWTITYTFKVVDECGNELTGQIYTNTGGDLEDPVISSAFCDATEPLQVTITSGCTFIADNSWDITATDNCGPVTISYVLTGDTESNGAVITNTLAGVEFNSGLTTITWFAEDGCGHIVSCTFDVNITVGPPSFVTPVPGDQVVDVDDSDVCTFTLTDDRWDVEVYDPCDQITLEYELTGATDSDGAVITNTLAGVVFNCGETTVTWTARDNGGQSTSHSFTVTVQPINLSGVVVYAKPNGDLPLEGIIVSLVDSDGDVVATTSTNASGYYIFADQADVLAASSIQFTSTMPFGGISAGDAYGISLRSSNDNPPYWTPAVFVDKVADILPEPFDPGITALDALYVFLRRTYQIETYFPDRDWAFFSVFDEVLLDNITANTGEKLYGKNFCTLDILVRTFGDVDGSYNPAPAKSFMPVETGDVIQVSPGEAFELPVKLAAETAFNAMTLILDYDAQKIEVIDVFTSIPEMFISIDQGSIWAEWYDEFTQTVSSEEAVITLVVRTLDNVVVTGNDVLFYVSNETEFTDRTGYPIVDASIVINGIDNTDTTVSTDDPIHSLTSSLNAFPNPFRNELSIDYAIVEPAEVRITLVNMMGAVVAELVNHRHSAGDFSYTLNPHSLNMEYGIYFVRMDIQSETQKRSHHLKLIFVR